MRLPVGIPTVGLTTAFNFSTPITADTTLYAKWTTVSSYTLTYSAAANGTIEGITPQTVAPGGSGTAVTAMPNSGYRFVKWSDNSTSNPRTDSNVVANITVTASFELLSTDTISPTSVVTRGDGKTVATFTAGTGTWTIPAGITVDGSAGGRRRRRLLERQLSERLRCRRDVLQRVLCGDARIRLGSRSVPVRRMALDPLRSLVPS